MDRSHVVAGAGPLGLAIVEQLTAAGHGVRLIARGGAPEAPEPVEVVPADLADPNDARRAFEGAAVVYHCANPPYAKWPELHPPLMRGVIAGAEAVGAKLVFGDNLYAYGPVHGPLTEDLPAAARGANGRTRAEIARMLLEAHEQGRVRATIGRGSDYVGPRCVLSTAGARVFANLLRGRPAQVLGDPDIPHAVTYIEDFARALVVLGDRDEALGGVWHVPTPPAVPMRRLVEMAAAEAGIDPKLRAAPRWALALASLFDPTVRAVREQLYQSERPWIVDSTRFESAFGLGPTPLEDAVAATVRWFRDHPEAGP